MKAPERIHPDRPSLATPPRLTPRAWWPLACVLLLAPALVRAQGAGSDSLTLHWTAPGDDGSIGTATSYDVRVSTSPITASNFDNATVVPNPPVPLPASTHQAMVVHGLTRGVPYWFAIKAYDEVGHSSPVSNVAQWLWPADASPPAAPSGLAATVQAEGKAVDLAWKRNTEPDLAGYILYRAEAANGPWERLNSALLASPTYDDTSVPASAPALWYTVTAADAVGNESPRAAPLRVPISTGVQQAPTAWRLLAPYPNPSRLAEPARIPIAVPASAGDAALEIVDGAGQLVRRLDVRGANVGIVELPWDGRNAAGALCAPGVYRAWLLAGPVRQLARIARVP